MTPLGQSDLITTRQDRNKPDLTKSKYARTKTRSIQLKKRHSDFNGITKQPEPQGSDPLMPANEQEIITPETFTRTLKAIYISIEIQNTEKTH